MHETLPPFRDACDDLRTLSRSLRSGPIEMGKRRTSAAASSSDCCASASSTSFGTPPFQLPAAGTCSDPHTLMKTLRPVSSTVLTTKLGSGTTSTPSASCICREQTSRGDGTRAKPARAARDCVLFWFVPAAHLLPRLASGGRLDLLHHVAEILWHVWVVK